MKRLLLLDYRNDYSSNDIWRATIQNGYATERVHDVSITERAQGYDFVRYYGNTLQMERTKDKILPFGFYPLDPVLLTSTPLTGRRVTLCQFRDVPNPLTLRTFVKPIGQKFFEAKVYEVGEKIDCSQLPEDWVYVQEPIDIMDEVRCFCLWGKVLTASYYRKNKELEMENIDGRLDDFPFGPMVEALYRWYRNPPGSVFDFGLTREGKWILIEQNEAWASGIYACDPTKCLDVIVNSEYSIALGRKGPAL